MLRPYRLTVRTPGFHPGNPGSIPGKVTIKGFIFCSAFEIARLLLVAGCFLLIVKPASTESATIVAVTIQEIECEFGQQVVRYVDVLTISSKQDVKQSFIRTAELGGDVLSIRAADLIQNSYYYHLAPVDM